MKILVTGATGFIGQRLVERLLETGHNVTCLVRETSRRERLEELGVSLKFADISSPEEVLEVFEELHPEVVFHCAARVWSNDKEKLMRDNALGTRNICRGCMESGVKRLVYLSSVAVVSGNNTSPLTEDLPFKTSGAYGESKIEAEKVALEYREKGHNVSIIRPCIVYGEDEPHALDTVFERIEKKMLPILDVPGMDSKLALAYVGNVVQVLELAMEKKEALEGSFMVADREVVTLRSFLNILYDEMSGGPPPVIPGWLVGILTLLPPLRRKAERFFKDRVYDISRTSSVLGYDPRVSTEEGLRRTLRHWKEKNRKNV